MVNDSLASGGFVDYRRSFDYARDAEAVLDQLEELLDHGAADAVAPALLRATTRLRKVIQYADDSGGVIGAAGQRAVDLYARACREGNPDPGALARWLVNASQKQRPGDAARLYVPKIEELLQVADTRRYAPAASMLADMRRLLVAAGEESEFTTYLAGIRERFGRRTSLMAALAKKGL